MKSRNNKLVKSDTLLEEGKAYNIYELLDLLSTNTEIDSKVKTELSNEKTKVLLIDTSGIFLEGVGTFLPIAYSDTSVIAEGIELYKLKDLSFILNTDLKWINDTVLLIYQTVELAK